MNTQEDNDMLILNDLDTVPPPSDWCFKHHTFAALIHPRLKANSSHIGSSQALVCSVALENGEPGMDK